MSNFIVKKVAVLGAGVMGAQIAAHCINARVPVILFDLAGKEGQPRNALATQAIEHLKKLSPAPLADAVQAELIETANFDDHLDKLLQVDLIIEAIAERMDWKHQLYAKIGAHIAPHAIFATNTSGLSITELASALPAELRSRFCGVHFFNPPRYMHLVELIPTAATQGTILDQLETFLTSTLGKGVVRAIDTPNFIANRVGVFGMLATMHEAEKYGLSYELVDDLTGAKLGRAKSGTFRTADVVGLDTLGHVIRTMTDKLPQDPFHSLYQPPAALAKLIADGRLGQKTGAGFFKKVGKDILRYDAASNDYVAAGAKADELIVRMLKEKDPAKRIKALHDSTHPQAQFLWAIFRDSFHYIAVHLAEVADNARDLDFALRWGFGWQQGPFELWQAAGWQQVAQWVKEDIDAGHALSKAPLPEWVFDGRDGVHSAAGSWSAARKAYVPRADLPVYARQLFRAPLVGSNTPHGRSAGATVHEDDAVRLWHQNDGVLIFSTKTKLHVLGPDVIAGLERAIAEAEKNYRALVIWHADSAEGGAFSAGADLQSMLPLFMSGGANAIEPFVARFQNAMMRVKYANVPVVAAVGGLALGGGCELMMHASRRVVLLESYTGLVEVGVGLVPAGGGLKEIALRSAREAKGNDILQFLKQRYMNAATAAVSKSALEAKKMGYLSKGDVIVLHPHELLHVASTQALALADAGYRPPLASLIPVTGRYGSATIKAQLVNMRDGSFISEHDMHIGTLIAEVVSGGDIEPGSRVSEQWLLDRERAAFISLLAHPKTQERIMGMLQTGKPVRN
ncbi:crotonase-like domain containing protein [Oxalobacteraceae bacterium]